MTAVAVASGILCAVCVGAFMLGLQGKAEADRAEAPSRYGGEQVQVCVATRNIAAGEKVDANAIQTKLWVSDLLPDRAVSDRAAIEGETATSPIMKGEVFTEGRFDATTPATALDVPAGRSAVSVPVKTAQAVGGALEAGMTVDLYAAGATQTAAVARGALVLATSSSSGRATDQLWVTLAVEPSAVEQVVAATQSSELCVVVPGAGASDAAGSAGAASAADKDGARSSASTSAAARDSSEASSGSRASASASSGSSSGSTASSSAVSSGGEER